MKTKLQVIALIRRLTNGGPLDALPKKHADARVLLALAASSLMPRQRYSEVELNEHLAEWLEGFTHPRCLDHVTIRRGMVDESMLHRDTRGSFYLVNETIVSLVLEPDARSVRPLDVYNEVQFERRRRKRFHPEAS